MGLIGAVWGLFVTGATLNAVALIGLIMLAGIVVNNAIVLIDAINQARERGLEKVAAIVEAGRTRLRPILITSVSTVLGLLPMAIGLGEGAEIRRPDGDHRHRRHHRRDVPDARRSFRCSMQRWIARPTRASSAAAPEPA